MKKLAVWMMMGMMAVSAVGCGSSSDNDDTAKQDTVQADKQKDIDTESESESEQTEIEQTETKQTEIEQSESEQSEPASETEASQDDQSEADSDEPVLEAGQQIYTSNYGFSFTYDPAVFQIEEADATARFVLIGREGSAESIPVYVASNVVTEYTAVELAEGLQLQSGTDEAVVEDTFIGADSYPAKQVYYTVETERGTEQMVFYLVQLSETDVIQIETCSAAEEDMETSSYVEALIGSFSLE